MVLLCAAVQSGYLLMSSKWTFYVSTKCLKRPNSLVPIAVNNDLRHDISIRLVFITLMETLVHYITFHTFTLIYELHFVTWLDFILLWVILLYRALRYNTLIHYFTVCC